MELASRHTVFEIIKNNTNLPYEIIDIICQHLSDIYLYNIDKYYKYYFDININNIVYKKTILRSKNSYVFGNNNLTCFLNNGWAILNCLDDKHALFANTGDNINKMIKLTAEFIFTWYFWTIDHSYIQKVRDIKEIFDDKIYAFYYYDAYIRYEDKITPSSWELIDDMHMFITNYTEYYYTDNRKPGGIYNEFYIKHCPDFDKIRYSYKSNIKYSDIMEFEMYLYDNKYYCNIYTKYMKLRSGKYVIPIGKQPSYYWYGNKLCKNFH